MLRTTRELLPLLAKGWWGLSVGGLGGAIGLVLDVFTDVTVPWWGWAAVGVAGVLGALVQAFHRMRVERDAFRPDPLMMGSWPIVDAVQYIVDDSKWGVSQKSKWEAREQVMSKIREAALNSYLTVWGRRRRSIRDNLEPIVPIPQQYWDDFAFHETSCLPYIPAERNENISSQTRRDRGNFERDERIYFDLHLVEPQVRSYWPRAHLWQRYKLSFSSLLVEKREQ